MSRPRNRLELCERLGELSAVLSRRDVDPYRRDRLLAERAALRAELEALDRHARERAPYERRRAA